MGWLIELKFGIAQLFEDMRMPKKFHAIWTCQNSTCFINILSDQNLRKITGEKWLDILSPDLVERDNMDVRMSW
jgi:hypothetical protein